MKATWTTNRVSAIALGTVAAALIGIIAAAGPGQLPSVQRLLGGEVVVLDTGENRYTFLSDSGKGVAQGTLPETCQIVDLIQQDGRATLITERNSRTGAVPLEPDTARPDAQALNSCGIPDREGEVDDSILVAAGTTATPDIYAARTGCGSQDCSDGGDATNRASIRPALLGNPAGDPTGNVDFDGPAWPFIGGRDGTVMVVDTENGRAVSVRGGRQGSSTDLSGPERTSVGAYTGTRGDGRPVVIDNVSGHITVFEDGRQVRTGKLPVPGPYVVSTDYEVPEIIVIAKPGGRKQLVGIDTQTGTPRTIAVADPNLIPDDEPPLVTPQHIFLVDRDGERLTIRTLDRRTGDVVAEEVSFPSRDGSSDEGGPRDPDRLDIDVVGGKVRIDDQASDESWLINDQSPGTARPTEENNDAIPDATGDEEPPASTTTTTIPAPTAPAGGDSAGSNGQGSPPPRVVAKPGAPYQLTATPGYSSVTVAWSGADSGGGEFKGSAIECAVLSGNGECGAGNRLSGPVPAESGSGAYVAIKLNNGTRYRFRVKVENEKGWGEWSDWATATPTTSVLAPPGNVVAEPKATEAGVVTVTWTADNDGYNGTPTGFKVYGPGGECAEAAPEATSAQVSGTCFEFDSNDDADVTFEVTALATPEGDNSVVESPRGAAAPIDPYRPAAPPSLTATLARDGCTVTLGYSGEYDRPVTFTPGGPGSSAQSATTEATQEFAVPCDNYAGPWSATATMNGVTTVPTSATPAELPLSPQLTWKVTQNDWNFADGTFDVDFFGWTGSCDCDPPGQSSSGNETKSFGPVTATNVWGLQASSGVEKITTPAPPAPPRSWIQQSRCASNVFYSDQPGNRWVPGGVSSCYSGPPVQPPDAGIGGFPAGGRSDDQSMCTFSTPGVAWISFNWTSNTGWSGRVAIRLNDGTATNVPGC